VQLDWATFALEIVNFLVLVWILKRFLYRPVMDAIARRRAAIEKNLADADARLAQAKDLETRYQKRLEAWKHEKESAQAALRAELDQERTRQLDLLKKQIVGEREKAQVLETRQAQESRRRFESEALSLSGKFCSRLLSRLASAELQTRILEATQEDLASLPEAQRETLGSAARAADGSAVVTCAFPLDDSQRIALVGALRDAAGVALKSVENQDPGLIAGVRIEIGSWVLHANLKDELRFFFRSDHE